mgnify:CR=1 FL=1
MKILITGGAGFIGCNLVRSALAAGHSVLNYDVMSYSANPMSLRDVEGNAAYRFVQGDICDAKKLGESVSLFQPNAIIHAAAETHVDRSIDSAAPFIQTNIVGTHVVLETALDYLRKGAQFKLIAVSTDEVFGSIPVDAKPAIEETPYDPSSPYAASKAAADHLVRSYARTHGVPAIITNCGNNYGPYQFPEKLIPHIILCALAEKPIPVYGDGMQIRDWIHVEDHNSALLHVLANGKANETYLISAHNEVRNIEIVKQVCAALDAARPRSSGSYADLITHVTDRPGHDRRYALDASKLLTSGWKPRVSFADGIKGTVAWYLQNQNWIETAFKGGYALERLGRKK